MGAPVASGTLSGSTSGSWASIRKGAASSDLPRLPPPPFGARTTLPSSRRSDVVVGHDFETAKPAEGARRHQCCEIRPWGRAAKLAADRPSAAAGCGEHTVRRSPAVKTTGPTPATVTVAKASPLVARRDDRSPGLRSSRHRRGHANGAVGLRDRDSNVDGARSGRRHRRA
jgi:hypothetical protein